MQADIDADHESFIAAVKRHTRDDGTVHYTKLADELGIHRTSAMRRVHAAGRKGLLGTEPVIPGFGITSESAVYNGRGDLVLESIRQKPQGEVTEKTRPGFGVKFITTGRRGDGTTAFEWTRLQQEPSQVDFAAMLKEAMANMPVLALPTHAPILTLIDHLTFYPLADLHFGLYAWGRETVDNWDLKIAERVISDVFAKVVARSNPTEECVILGGGDQMHADNNDNQTSRSHNVLQVDGRYQKVLLVVCMFFVKLVHIALAKHKTVRVRILKGNHDDHAAVALAYFLLAHFRNEPRVIVDADPSTFWKHLFGRTFLAAHHGHECRPAEFDRVMASRWREEWGKATHSYGHLFHVHNKAVIGHTKGGAYIETHETPIPPDVYAFNHGFWSDRSLQSITYSARGGEVGRVREPVLDHHQEERLAA